MKKLRAMKDKRGFTLIELIIVIAILAILAAIAIPAMAGYVGQSEQAVADANARTLYGAASAAGAQHDVVPFSGRTFSTLITNDFEKQIAILLGKEFKGTLGITIGIETDAGKMTATWTDGKKSGSYPN